MNARIRTTSAAPTVLDTRASTSTEVARRLLALLASERLRDGDRIPSERVLSQSLHAPRSVVREALRSLSLIGLLESHPGRGTSIHANDSEWVGTAIEWGLLLGVPNTMDLVETRGHLEVLSAALAAQNRDEQDPGADPRAGGRDGERGAGPRAAHAARCRLPHEPCPCIEERGPLSASGKRGRAPLEVWITRVLDYVPAESLHGETYTEHGRILEAVARRDVEEARALMADAMAHGERMLQEALQASRRRTAVDDRGEAGETSPRPGPGEGGALPTGVAADFLHPGRRSGVRGSDSSGWPPSGLAQHQGRGNRADPRRQARETGSATRLDPGRQGSPGSAASRRVPARGSHPVGAPPRRGTWGGSRGHLRGPAVAVASRDRAAPPGRWDLPQHVCGGGPSQGVRAWPSGRSSSPSRSAAGRRHA